MMSTHENLSDAVLAIYPDIERRVGSEPIMPSEVDLWFELSCCLLSSQVPFSMAQAAAEAIANERLLLVSYRQDLHDALEGILSTKLTIGKSQRSYRFPASRAKQLASTKHAICNQFGSLTNLLDHFDNPTCARQWLVDHAPGIGPKQASMFLRNVGFTYDLAIIDRHVLNYMIAVNMSPEIKKNMSGLSGYHQHERILQNHAKEIGAQIGMLDWAIWIVMRVRGQSATEQSSFEWS